LLLNAVDWVRDTFAAMRRVNPGKDAGLLAPKVVAVTVPSPNQPVASKEQGKKKEEAFHAPKVDVPRGPKRMGAFVGRSEARACHW
jgi:hypothetical protein